MKNRGLLQKVRRKISLAVDINRMKLSKVDELIKFINENDDYNSAMCCDFFIQQNFKFLNQNQIRKMIMKIFERKLFNHNKPLLKFVIE